MKRRVVITGADGFIGRNVRLALSARADFETVCFSRPQDASALPAALAIAVSDADAVIHLAGVNRSADPADFLSGNAEFGRALAEAVSATGRQMPVIYASSTQAALDNPYGASKRAAEEVLRNESEKSHFPLHVFRLPNVFGKWARPNYNSAVATFCHNLARGLPITIDDAAAPLALVYIDDVVSTFLAILEGAEPELDQEGFAAVRPVYQTSVGYVAETIAAFARRGAALSSGLLERGWNALYTRHTSATFRRKSLGIRWSSTKIRGVVSSKCLRTRTSGQFSFFTAHPGVTRGGHYHHTKTEKFLVVSGTARFGFRHMLSGETYALETRGDIPEVVDTIPGWTHDITNVGNDTLVVMLWANELFDPAAPDTFACPVGEIPVEPKCV